MRITRFVLTLILMLHLLPLSAQQRGIATYYGKKHHGAKTASGTRLDNNALVCAHRTYPIGTILQVKDVKTGKKVEVKVIDRGPFVRGYIIDLSYRAAQELGIISKGKAQVEVTPVNQKKQ